MQGNRNILLFVFFVSLLWVLGSLYLSTYGDPVVNLMSWDFFNTLNGIAACDMCRYIRVVMFPLPVISWIALWKNDNKVFHTILILAAIGFWLALYKYWIQYRWWWSVLCDRRATTPCSSMDVEYFGFMSMAFFWMVAFLSMMITSIYAIYSQDSQHVTDSAS